MPKEKPCDVDLPDSWLRVRAGLMYGRVMRLPGVARWMHFLHKRAIKAAPPHKVTSIGAEFDRLMKEEGGPCMAAMAILVGLFMWLAEDWTTGWHSAIGVSILVMVLYYVNAWWNWCAYRRLKRLNRFCPLH